MNGWRKVAPSIQIESRQPLTIEVLGEERSANSGSRVIWALHSLYKQYKENASNECVCEEGKVVCPNLVKPVRVLS
jgi:hypothetical protein